jgi:hypothetical protein
MTDHHRPANYDVSEKNSATTDVVNPVDDIRRLARDIEQSFGMYTLASFDHIDGDRSTDVE